VWLANCAPIATLLLLGAAAETTKQTFETSSGQSTWHSLSVHPGGYRVIFGVPGALFQFDRRPGSDPKPFPIETFRQRQPDSVSHSALFSPHGEQIAVSSDAGGQDNLTLAAANGQAPRRLSDLEGVALSGPSLTPEGERPVARLRSPAARGRLAFFDADPQPDAAFAEPECPALRPALQDIHEPWVPPRTAADDEVWIAIIITWPVASRPSRRQNWQLACIPLARSASR